MAGITKPPVVPIWGDDISASPDLVQPTDAQIKAGWPVSATPPARGRFNWILKFASNAVRYFSRRGIVDYDAAETYMTGDTVRGDDGKLTRSLVDNNIAQSPSMSPTKWGGPWVYQMPVDDNTAAAASTAWFNGQLAATNPVMNGAAAIGTSKKVARADHVHPSDTSKANTSGNYPNLNVGFATSATTAARARPLRSDGVSWDVLWSGQGGQPTWLLGSNNGVDFYVWNPANFSVNVATFAYYSNTQGNGAWDTSIATTAFGKNISLGWGQGWQGIGLGNGEDYYNDSGKPMQFNFSVSCAPGGNAILYVDGVPVGAAGASGSASSACTLSAIVPPGSTVTPTWGGPINNVYFAVLR